MITYKDAGVDIDKAQAAIERCKETILSTFNPYVFNPVGGFASIGLIPKEFKEPVLVTSTDGVGTKLKIAFLAKKHDTVGIDLVAMCVNDILTFGAKPYFFLDYFACGRLDEKIYEDVIRGICAGCKEAGCALVGGETAEMPGFYREEEYDLAGFVIGFVEKDQLIDGSKIKEGDIIIGLPSNGIHSNGLSLARKIFFEIHGFSIQERLKNLDGSLSEVLLRPTRIYTKTVLELLKEFSIHGMAHITGGGIIENVKRIIPSGLCAEITLKFDEIPAIFKTIMELGPIAIDEMIRTFNMGIGYILIVEEREKEKVIERLEKMGEKGRIIGQIKESEEKVRLELL